MGSTSSVTTLTDTGFCSGSCSMRMPAACTGAFVGTTYDVMSVACWSG